MPKILKESVTSVGKCSNANHTHLEVNSLLPMGEKVNRQKLPNWNLIIELRSWRNPFPGN